MALPTPEVTELPEEVKRARDAAARRASLRAAPAATAAPITAPVAPAAPEAVKAGGWFRRTANALRSGATAAGEVATAAPGKMAALPGQILNADLGAAAKGALRVGEGAAKTVGGALSGPTARVAAPIAAITSAAGSYGTDTDTYAQRTGIERGASDWTGKGTDAGSRLRFDAVKDAGIRALGTAQDLGNTLTFGLADRVGNALAGNGFNRSAGNQVGEVFGRGSEVGDNQPPATAAPAAPATPAAPTTNYGNEHLRGPVASQPPTNVVTRTGNSFSGTDVKQGFTYANGSQGKGTVTSLDTSEGHRQNLLELQRNATERANAPAPAGAAGIGGAGSTTMSQDLRAKTNAGQTPSGLSPYDAAQLQQQQAQTQQQGELGRAQIAATQTGNNNQLRVAEMNNATQRENNAATTRTAMRGHELDFQGRMAPIEVARQQRLRAATYMQGGGAAEGGAGGAGGRYAAAAQAAAANGDDALAQHFAALATGEQSRGAAVDAQQASRAAGTEKLFKPFFTKDVTGKDGTVSQQFDEVGAAKAAATVRGMYGEKFDKLSDDQKRSAILEVVAQQRNADAEAQVMPGFIDRAKDLFGMYDAPAPIQGGRRDIRGGKPEKAGLISPPGVSRHDTLLRLPNGQTVNYGVVTDQQIADINERRRLR